MDLPRGAGDSRVGPGDGGAIGGYGSGLEVGDAGV